MIKICNLVLVKALAIIFNNFVINRTFPYVWKKSNVIPVHKKTISSSLITIDLFHYYLYLEKYLKG